MASLSGRVISITGAASGMGNAFAKLAVAMGARVALADVQRERLESFADELRSSGAEATSTVLDVGSHADVKDWIDNTVKHFGKLDGAANIAGILPPHQKFADSTPDLWDKVMRTNLFGVMNCVHAQVKVMGKGASIVNYASVAGITPHPLDSIYGISKQGVIGLTKSVAKEVGADGIRVNAVAPGPIKTPMTQARIDATQVSPEMVDQGIAAMVPLGRWGQPDEVAKLTAFLLSDDASYIHGSIAVIDGGFI